MSLQPVSSSARTQIVIGDHATSSESTSSTEVKDDSPKAPTLKAKEIPPLKLSVLGKKDRFLPSRAAALEVKESLIIKSPVLKEKESDRSSPASEAKESLIAKSSGSKKKHSPGAHKTAQDIERMFDKTIKDLHQELQPVMGMPPEKQVEAAEPIVKESYLYIKLKKANKQQNLNDLLAAILYFNQHCLEFPDNENSMRSAVLTCLKLLLRDKDWKTEDASRFLEQLYLAHTWVYGYRGVTPVLEIYDGGLAALYLSPKSQRFMESVTYKSQFEPTRKCLKKAWGKFDKKEMIETIARIAADGFFIVAVRNSYHMMSRNIHSFPIQAIPLLNKTELADGIEGLREFKQNCLSHKNSYMRGLRELHLAFVARAKAAQSQQKSSMKFIEKKATFSGEPCTVSFAGVVEKNKMTIKAMTVAFDSTDQVDDYFYVQELVEETPYAEPDPKIPLFKRPLYKLEVVPVTNLVRLQRASEEVRKRFLEMNLEIKHEVNLEAANKITVENAVMTAIWHQAVTEGIVNPRREWELLLVDVLAQMGGMLSGRALYGKIKTYVKNLPQPTKGELSDPAEFVLFKKQLLDVLIGGHVLVTNDYLAGFHQVELLDPLHSIISQNITETKLMKAVKERTWELFNDHKRPGKFLFKSIATCTFDPQTQMMPFFEPLKALLKTALENQEEEEVLALVGEMEKSIIFILRNSNDALVDLTQFFASENGYPFEKIPEVVEKAKTMQELTSRLIYLFFSQKELGMEVSKTQMEGIKKYLK